MRLSNVVLDSNLVVQSVSNRNFAGYSFIFFGIKLLGMYRLITDGKVVFCLSARTPLIMCPGLFTFFESKCHFLLLLG